MTLSGFVRRRLNCRHNLSHLGLHVGFVEGLRSQSFECDKTVLAVIPPGNDNVLHVLSAGKYLD